jgi:hypothetical protein
VETVVVPVDVIGIDAVKLLQTVNLRSIKSEKELLLDTPPIAFLFAFFSPVPGTAVDNDNAKGSTDQRKLFIGIRRAVVQPIPNSE